MLEHEGIDGNGWLDPISTGLARTPSGTTIELGNISYNGNFSANFASIADNNNFLLIWKGVFDVSIDGPGDYSFGINSDDGSVLYIDLNDDGDFDDGGEKIADYLGYHGAGGKRTGTVNLTENRYNIAIGFFQGGGGNSMQARFQKGTGVGYDSQTIINGSSGYFYTGTTKDFAPAQVDPATNITARSAYLNGSVNADATNYNVFVAWDTQDNGTNYNAWVNNAFVTSLTNVDTNVTYYLNGLSDETVYYYRYAVYVDALGRYEMSDDVESFRTDIDVSKYPYSSEITICGYTNNTALNDFPLLVRISESIISGFDYGTMGTIDGSDLRFFTTNAFQEAAQLAGGGFESPDEGASGWNYSPASPSWTFTGNSGQAGPTSPWICDTTSPDPKGDQFAFFQGASSIDQTISGLTIGRTYSFSFYESYRVGQSPGNDMHVILDQGLPTEQTLYSNTNVSNRSWQQRNTTAFVALKSSYTLTLEATHPIGSGDRTTIIDGLVLNEPDPNAFIELTYEIQSWNPGGESLVWVNIPSLNANANSFTMRWGNPQATPPSYSLDGSTWPSKFIGVWHLDDDDSDATPNGNDATSNTASDSAGLLSGADNFSGDTMQLPNNIGDAAAGAVSLWMKTTADLSDSGALFFGSDNTGGNGFGTQNELHLHLTSAERPGFYARGGGDINITGPDAVNDDEWHHLMAVWDRSASITARLYVDGVEVGTSANVGNNYNFSQRLRLGSMANGSRTYTGDIDEVHYMSEVPPAEWVSAVYLNQQPNSSFLCYGSVELIPQPVIISDTPTVEGPDSARLRAEILSVGAASTRVIFYYGPTDGGTNASAWTNSVDLGSGQSVGPVSTLVSSLTPDVTYFARAFASNAAGSVWATDTETFLPGEITLTTTVGPAFEEGPVNGLLTLTRPATSTNGPLTVSLGISGTALSGADYAAIPPFALFAEGQDTVQITVQVVDDSEPAEPAETVFVEILDGVYNIGSPSNGTVTIYENDLIEIPGQARLTGTTLTDTSTDPNTASWKTIAWVEDYLDSDVFSFDAGNPGKLVVTAPGDYFIAFTIPVSTLDYRPAVAAEVYINGVRVDWTRTECSYMRVEAQQHTDSGDHMAAMLSNLSAGDEIEIRVMGTARIVPVTLGTCTLHCEYLSEDRVVFAATGTTNTLNNLNDPTPSSMHWDTSLRKDSGYTHSDGSSDITLDDAGTYLVTVNIPIYRADSAQRPSILAQLHLDGSPVPGGSARQGYIRSIEGHDDSSVHFSGIVTATAGQILTIETSEDSQTGDVQIRAGLEASVYVEKLDVATGVFSARGTVLSSGSDWNPGSEGTILWQTGVIHDTNIYTHSTSVDAGEITVNQGGSYLLIYNDSLTSSAERVSPLIEVRVNDTPVDGAETRTHYIRNLSPHNSSSASLVFPLQNISSGDIITLTSIQDAGSGTVTANDDAQITLIRKSESSPSILTAGSTNVTVDSATLLGDVITLREFPTTGYAFWGPVNQGTNAGAWANADLIGPVDFGPISNNITNLTADTSYAFRFAVSNSLGLEWARDTLYFITGDLDVQATDANGSEIGPDSVTFQFTRPASTTNGNLVVNFSLSGTAINGVDYSTVPTSIIIADGQQSASVVITPIADSAINEGNEYITVTIEPGAYTIGTGSATAGIADASSIWDYTLDLTFCGYQGSTPLTNFPVLIALGDHIPGFSYSMFADPLGGGDLRFVSDDNLELPYEIDRWDTNGISHVWVKMPVLGTPSDSITALIGNAGETTPPSYTTDGSTWNSSYKGVWHMGETDALVEDSTANSHDATGMNGFPTSTAGLIGRANDFVDSEGDRIGIPQSSDFDVGNQFTVSAWVYSHPNGGDEAICGTFNAGWIMAVRNTSPNNEFWWYSNNSNWEESNVAVAENVWSHLAITYRNGVPTSTTDGKLYINGQLVNSRDLRNQTTTKNLYIGAGGPNWSSQRFDGFIDELRIASAERSGDWLKACYDNQIDPLSFVCYDTPKARIVITTGIGATNVTANTAWITGYVEAADPAQTAVRAYYGETDGTNNALAWDTFQLVSSNVPDGNFSDQLTGLSANTLYYYRNAASNNVVGNYWATNSRVFITADVTLEAIDLSADETGPDNGLFRVTRPGGLTSEPLPVNYTITGTSSNGADYTYLSGTVIIPQGSNTADIVIETIDDLVIDEGPETVILTLATGGYDIGSPSSGTVTIQENELPSSGWTYSTDVRFCGYDRPSHLTNFPVLIKLDATRMPFLDYNQFADPVNGSDLRIVGGFPRTLLPYDIERWDTNGTSYIWVRLEHLIDTNSFITLLWGNNSETNFPSYVLDNSTWSHHYQAVWHLGEETGSALPDASGNQIDGVMRNMNSLEDRVPALIGGGIRIDGIDEYMDMKANADDLNIGGTRAPQRQRLVPGRGI